MASLLKALYRDHSWQVSKFVDPHQLPMRYWNDKRNQRAALEDIAKVLGVTEVKIVSLFSLPLSLSFVL